MYNIGAIDNSATNKIFIGIKYKNIYRYYALVNLLESAYTISLVDLNQNILDHYINFNIAENIEKIVLELCIEYDKFWYPELFESDVQHQKA